jgi:hypothetical protein
MCYDGENTRHWDSKAHRETDTQTETSIGGSTDGQTDRQISM